jgi:hypothetical protein
METEELEGTRGPFLVYDLTAIDSNFQSQLGTATQTAVKAEDHSTVAFLNVPPSAQDKRRLRVQSGCTGHRFSRPLPSPPLGTYPPCSRPVRPEAVASVVHCAHYLQSGAGSPKTLDHFVMVRIHARQPAIDQGLTN